MCYYKDKRRMKMKGDYRMNCICDTGDERLDAMLKALTGNFFGTSADDGTLLVTEENAFVTSEEYSAKYSALIVLYTDERYTYSKKHRELAGLYGKKYRAVSRPVDIALFCDTLREISNEGTYPAPPLSLEEEHVTYANRVISHGNRTVRLTAREDELFRLMYEHRGRVVSRERIATSIWGSDTSTNVTDVYMSYLRRKLSSVFGNGILSSVRGEGYILNMPSDENGIIML